MFGCETIWTSNTRAGAYHWANLKAFFNLESYTCLGEGHSQILNIERTIGFYLLQLFATDLLFCTKVSWKSRTERKVTSSHCYDSLPWLFIQHMHYAKCWQKAQFKGKMHYSSWLSSSHVAFMALYHPWKQAPLTVIILVKGMRWSELIIPFSTPKGPTANFNCYLMIMSASKRIKQCLQDG